MSTIGLERLARAAEQVSIAAGDAVVREGEPADSFYVVVDGVLSVTQHGRPVRRVGPGSCFGEVGLLDRGPRTATVLADSDVTLLRVGGPGFVAAVTGHRPSDAAVRGAVAAYHREDEQRRDLG